MGSAAAKKAWASRKRRHKRSRLFGSSLHGRKSWLLEWNSSELRHGRPPGQLWQKKRFSCYKDLVDFRVQHNIDVYREKPCRS